MEIRLRWSLSPRAARAAGGGLITKRGTSEVASRSTNSNEIMPCFMSYVYLYVISIVIGANTYVRFMLLHKQ